MNGRADDPQEFHRASLTSRHSGQINDALDAAASDPGLNEIDYVGILRDVVERCTAAADALDATRDGNGTSGRAEPHDFIADPGDGLCATCGMPAAEPEASHTPVIVAGPNTADDA